MKKWLEDATLTSGSCFYTLQRLLVRSSFGTSVGASDRSVSPSVCLLVVTFALQPTVYCNCFLRVENLNRFSMSMSFQLLSL